ncbi:hypothetical protein [Prosthecobacter sp.]|uniref:hypothetical protein n=1 Tax=Prosthecobacter sp. TaxID=1965333 RepID=UPI0037850D3D
MKSTILSILILAFAPWIVAAESPTLGTAEDAVLHLQQIWRGSLASKLKGSPFFPSLQHQMFEPNRVGARRTSAVEAWKHVSGKLTPQERQTLILVGKLDDLKRDRPVWVVTNPGDLGSGFEAYLDATTGEVLFLWIGPEG